jgi:cation diffusion facilitator CzcD-associated flavoprotein CzcO
MIVGAGQAGLVMSHTLGQRGLFPSHAGDSEFH